MDLQSHCTCPVKDCDVPVDLILKSCDEELIGAHQTNMERYSEGFPVASASFSTTDPVDLTETAEVLRFMLQFMHHVRQPDLKTVEFGLLAGLAEAAEKYMIYSAMNVCKIYMELAAEEHPIEVFLYASKHGYSDVADKAAKLTLGLSASVFLDRAKASNLPDSLTIQWYRYREQWSNIFIQHILPEPRGNMRLHKGGAETCEAWPPFHFAVIQGISGSLDKICELSTFVQDYRRLLDACLYCDHKATCWVREVNSSIAQTVQPFSRA